MKIKLLNVFESLTESKKGKTAQDWRGSPGRLVSLFFCVFGCNVTIGGHNLAKLSTFAKKFSFANGLEFR